MRDLEKFADIAKIFPNEFHPPNQRSWGGISLREWMNYILKESK